MTAAAPQHESIFRQPTSVWAVAFACVVAFMGIGLVDPILPAISAELDATTSEALLLFTSYLFVTGITMFFTSWLSSRIGAKAALLWGLALIIVFATLAGASGNVEWVIGFRAGWGLGNALFISTALATIIGAASGGVAGAIILYEAALGVGIAVGPLLGGLLGAISWRGPFFGTAALMLIALLALFVLLRKSPEKPHPVPLTASLRALGRPVLLVLGITALFYNFGFFVLLAYSPYPLAANAAAAGQEAFGAHELGLIFFGWGIAVAASSVLVAPLCTRWFGRRATLIGAFVLISADLAVMALGVANQAVLIVGIVAGGLVLGVVNTVLTETVMESTDLPRQVASGAYSGVRFMGGALAPALAGPLAASFGVPVPYWVGAGAVLIAVAMVVVFWRLLAPAESPEELPAVEEAEAISLGDA
ncbi:MAG: MFS transporter [Microbacterium sp.]|nr:MFS transporter [Microbacterium sp.]